ncbi:MAG: TraB/GumN family protein [Bacteroidales bacterium]|nr:TraB/GumN family protein [Bacteroidales bacterium]
MNSRMNLGNYKFYIIKVFIILIPAWLGSGISSANTTQKESSLLWKITGNGLDKPSYLFGTYHVTPPQFLDSVAGFKKAFASVQQYAGETDVTKNIEFPETRSPYLPKDTTYKDLLSSSDLQYLDIILSKYLPEWSINKVPVRPAYLQYVLTTTIFSSKAAQLEGNKVLKNTTYESGLDSYLWKTAKNNALDLIQLETEEDRNRWRLYEHKKGSFDGNLKEDAENLITVMKFFESDTLDIITRFIQLSIEIKEAYFEQNLIKFEDLNTKSLEIIQSLNLDADDLSSTLDLIEKKDNIVLKERNLFWMEKIPFLIQSKPTFIAVGTSHLIGEYGVINLLRKEGYMVEPVLGE